MEENNVNKPDTTIGTNATAPTTCEGTVKSFDLNRRYGFIAQDGGQEVFVHQEAILDETAIAAGDRVSFELTAGPKGPRAASVRKL